MNKSKAVNIRMPLELYQTLLELARADERSVTNWILVSIKKTIEEHQEREEG